MRKLVLKSLLMVALGAATGSIYAQQSGLPINAAASVNGVIITNDMVEQGIRVALSQGQKDSPELRRAVIQKYIDNDTIRLIPSVDYSAKDLYTYEWYINKNWKFFYDNWRRWGSFGSWSTDYI